MPKAEFPFSFFGCEPIYPCLSPFAIFIALAPKPKIRCLFLLELGRKATAHRSATDVEAVGDLGFAEAGLAQFADLIGMHGCGCGSTQALAVLPGMCESGPYALPCSSSQNDPATLGLVPAQGGTPRARHWPAPNSHLGGSRPLAAMFIVGSLLGRGITNQRTCQSSGCSK